MAEHPIRKYAVKFLLGIGAGAAFGYVAASSGVLDAVFERGLSPADAMAMLFSAGLIAMGILSLAASANPQLYRRLMPQDPAEPDEPLDPVDIANARRQAVVVFTAAIALALPPVAMLAGAEQPARLVSTGAILALVAIEALFNWKLWRNSDELSRRVIVETAAATFWITQMLLFGYAALVRLELAPEVGSWALLQILLVIYLTVAGAIGVRRGLARA